MGRVIIAAADGSSLANPGPTGWAWYVDDDNWAAGGWPQGTNNQGELMAVLDLLRQTAVAGPIHILCDSQYVINSLTKWLPGWKRKGWRKADGKPVLNVELLQQLDQALAGRSVTFEWVKGHAGHELNEQVDDLARAAATAFRDGTPVAAGPGWRGSGASAPTRTGAALPRPQTSMAQTPPPAVSDLVGPDFEAAPDLFSVVAEPSVPELEWALLSAEVRSDPAEVAALLHPDFIEIGASGRVWTRAETLAEIGPLPTPVVPEFLALEELSPVAQLLRYRTLAADGSVYRSSLWWLVDGRWRLRFHQGTKEI